MKAAGPADHLDDDDEHIVKKELDEVKALASSFKPAELKDGSWFTRLLRATLETYTKKVNWQYFTEKYAGLPPDAIADRRIELAQRYAMIEGGLSASAYSAAVAATIGTAGGASWLTIPGAISSFTVDLLYVSRLQIHLAYDLAVLYRHSIDMDDPEDLYDLIRVAFGIKAGEALRGAVPRLAPEAVRQGTKMVVKGQILALLQALPIIGKHLLQRNVIKFAIPLVCVPLSMKLNHYQTGRVGKQARTIYRDKAAIKESAVAMADKLESFPGILLQAIWLVIQADGKVQAEESWLLKSLLEELSDSPHGTQAATEFAEMINFDYQKFYSNLASLSDEMRKEVYEAACQAAAIDHDMHAKELDVLRDLAEKCGVHFDPKALKARAKG